LGGSKVRLRRLVFVAPGKAFACAANSYLHKTMDVPGSAQLLLEIERLQDDVLRELDELDERLEQALRESQAQLRRLPPADAA
jgi:hypothetical protein